MQDDESIQQIERILSQVKDQLKLEIDKVNTPQNNGYAISWTLSRAKDANSFCQITVTDSYVQEATLSINDQEIEIQQAKDKLVPLICKYFLSNIKSQSMTYYFFQSIVKKQNLYIPKLRLAALEITSEDKIPKGAAIGDFIVSFFEDNDEVEILTAAEFKKYTKSNQDIPAELIQSGFKSYRLKDALLVLTYDSELLDILFGGMCSTEYQLSFESNSGFYTVEGQDFIVLDIDTVSLEISNMIKGLSSSELNSKYSKLASD